jgi:hypothetical protein
VTQQPSSISHQIISQGDNFFVFHLLNDADLQTLKRHNAYFSDEILEFIRSEPIPGNCYFWSAPSQPFVLPARVCNFESVCRRVSEPAREAQHPSPDPRQLNDLVTKAVKEALVSNPAVWLYPVSSLEGKQESGFIAVSRDYLFHAVYAKLTNHPAIKVVGDGNDSFEKRLSDEIETVLKQHKARLGYATLAGAARPVLVLRHAQLKLEKAKTLRSERVEVVERI